MMNDKSFLFSSYEWPRRQTLISTLSTLRCQCYSMQNRWCVHSRTSSKDCRSLSMECLSQDYAKMGSSISFYRLQSVCTCRTFYYCPEGGTYIPSCASLFNSCWHRTYYGLFRFSIVYKPTPALIWDRLGIVTPPTSVFNTVR